MYIKYVHNILKHIKKVFLFLYKCSDSQYCCRTSADLRFQMIVKSYSYCKIIIFGANRTAKKSKYKVVAPKCISTLDEIRVNHVF